MNFLDIYKSPITWKKILLAYVIAFSTGPIVLVAMSIYFALATELDTAFLTIIIGDVSLSISVFALVVTTIYFIASKVKSDFGKSKRGFK